MYNDKGTINLLKTKNYCSQQQVIHYLSTFLTNKLFKVLIGFYFLYKKFTFVQLFVSIKTMNVRFKDFSGLRSRCRHRNASNKYLTSLCLILNYVRSFFSLELLQYHNE